MPTQKHLQDFTPFHVSVEGIELDCLIEYMPAGVYDEQPYEASASCEYVILDGRDITAILSEALLTELANRYMSDLNEQASNARTERRIDALERAA